MPLGYQEIQQLKRDQLLDALIEEYAELIYLVSKMKRYGVKNRNPFKNSEDNLTEFHIEDAQVLMLKAELNDRYGGAACRARADKIFLERVSEQRLKNITYDYVKKDD